MFLLQALDQFVDDEQVKAALTRLLELQLLILVTVRFLMHALPLSSYAHASLCGGPSNPLHPQRFSPETQSQILDRRCTDRFIVFVFYNPHPPYRPP